MIKIEFDSPAVADLKQAIEKRDNRKQFRFEPESPKRKPLTAMEAHKFASDYLGLPKQKLINKYE